MNRALGSAFLVAAGLFLQGCGGGDDTTTTTTTASGTTTSTKSGPTTASTTTTTTSTPTSPAGYVWKSNPIEVRGSHLFDSVTGEPFLAAGIAFPNLADAPIDEWIDVLKRIKNYSANVNLIRIYEYPSCIWDTRQGYCFEPFMRAADELGVYVLAAGTGTVSGYLPLDGWKNASDAYQMGAVLDFGRAVIQRFYYPNTLALVIGNEFLRESTWPIATILKAYARDLKKYMATCRDDEASPSHSTMRQLPLIYASNDDYGDELGQQKAAYLFCGNASTSVDIFGLNVERWCDPDHHVAYDGIHAWVSAGRFPGGFLFTEMGCSKDSGYHATGARDWAQVPLFFSKFPAFDGFSAYAYWNAGATNFNMFDGKGANATIYDDGLNFFKAMETPGRRDQLVDAQAHPDCPAQMGVSGKMATLELLDNVPGYNEEGFPAEECPEPRTTLTAMAPVAV